MIFLKKRVYNLDRREIDTVRATSIHTEFDKSVSSFYIFCAFESFLP